MKCVWVAGTCSFLTVVVMLALLPCLVPAPLSGDAERGIARAAVETPVHVANVTAASLPGDGRPVPVAMTFVADEPREVGRLFVNEQGKLEFEGDVEASAKAFVDAVIRRLEEQKTGAQ